MHATRELLPASNPRNRKLGHGYNSIQEGDDLMYDPTRLIAETHGKVNLAEPDRQHRTALTVTPHVHPKAKKQPDPVTVTLTRMELHALYKQIEECFLAMHESTEKHLNAPLDPNDLIV
jgi:hypothetical protein